MFSVYSVEDIYMTELLDKLSPPLQSYNGRTMEIVTLDLYIPKSEATIQKYTFNGDECDEWEDNIRDKNKWRLIWNTSPINPSIFSMHVRNVYDVPDMEYYLVTIWISKDTDLLAFNKYLMTPESIDWETILLPWKQYVRYAYA